MIPNVNDDRETIELFISCRSLTDKDVFSKSDPKVKVFYSYRGKEINMGVTEFIKNELNPNFKKTFTMDYIFEERQNLRFEVWDHDTDSADDLIGRVDTTVGAIVGARNQILILDLKDQKNKTGGKIIIRADRIKEGNTFVWWQWNGIKLINVDGWFDKSDPFLRFLKKSPSGDYLLQYETEFIQDNLNPIWKPFTLNINKLSGGSNDQIFRVECWDREKSGKHKFMGFMETNFKQILVDKKQLFPIMDAQNKKKTGDLKIMQINIVEKPSFMDYLRGGEQLNMMVAVDFTGSNGDPRQSTSLHAIKKDGTLNQYQTAIYEVCDILLNYDFDKKVPVYGFGGKPRFPNYNSQVVDHCFPLTGNPQAPEVFGLEGIMGVYEYALTNVGLSGPTLFSKILRYAMDVAKINEPSNIYTILLILTDGEINDMSETSQLIEACRMLSMSVIIIGIGNAQFGNMKILDGDDDVAGKKGRDLVQFVAFNDHKGDSAGLAKEVLAELPSQLVNYKQSVGKLPKPPVQITNSVIQV